MTNEASTMVVVARAALEGALRAALPHVARKIPEDAPDNGAGLMRLAVVQDCVMVLAVAIDRKRAIAVRFNVLDGDSYSDGVKSMWLRRSAVESLATFLAGVPVERVSSYTTGRQSHTWRMHCFHLCPWGALVNQRGCASTREGKDCG